MSPKHLALTIDRTQSHIIPLQNTKRCEAFSSATIEKPLKRAERPSSVDISQTERDVWSVCELLSDHDTTGLTVSSQQLVSLSHESFIHRAQGLLFKRPGVQEQSVIENMLWTI